MIHDQTLDQFCKRNDKILRTADLNDRIDDGIVICFFVQNFRFLCDQFFNHIGIIYGKSFSYFGPGIFGGCCLTDFNKTVESDLIPVFHIFFCIFDKIHLLFRIINKSSKGLFIPATHSIPEYIINFTAH